MIIVPYIHSKRPTKVLGQDAFIHVIRILCDRGGEALWEEADEGLSVDTVGAVVLEPNELVVTGAPLVVTGVADSSGSSAAKALLIPIDPVATDMSSMYSYEEITPGSTDMLCWRTFYHVTDTAGTALLRAPVVFAAVIDSIVVRT